MFKEIRLKVMDIIRRSIYSSPTSELDNSFDDSSDDDSDENSEDDSDNNDFPAYSLSEFLMNEKVFDKLISRLPVVFENSKVKYELDRGRLIIHTFPADIHSLAVTAWSTIIESWGNNGQIPDSTEPALINSGDACSNLFILLLTF